MLSAGRRWLRGARVGSGREAAASLHVRRRPAGPLPACTAPTSSLPRSPPPAPLQAHGGDPLIPFSGALEAKLLDMPEDERATYCKEASRGAGGGAGGGVVGVGAGRRAVPRAGQRRRAASMLREPGPARSGGRPTAPDLLPPLCPAHRAAPQNELASALPKIVTAGFKAVRLIYYFTAGVQEVRLACLSSCRGCSPEGRPAGRQAGRLAASECMTGERLPCRLFVQCGRPGCWRPQELPRPTDRCSCLPPPRGRARRCAAGRSGSTPRRRRRRAPSTPTLSAASSALR